MIMPFGKKDESLPMSIQTKGTLLPTLIPFGEQETVSSRYRQLGRVDREHATSLVRSCKARLSDAKASRFLVFHSHIQSWLTSMPLMLGDFVLLWLLLFGTTSIVERLYGLPTVMVTRNSATLASLLLWPIAQLAGLYPAMGTSPAVEFRQLVKSAGVALFVFAGIGIMHNPSAWMYLIGSTLLTLCLAVPLLPTSRFVMRALARRCKWWGAPALIYTDSATVGAEIYRRLRGSQERGLHPVGVVLESDESSEEAAILRDLSIPVFSAKRLLRTAFRSKATWVLIAKPSLVNVNHAWSDDESVNSALHAIPNRVFLSSYGGFDCGMWDRTHTVGTSAGLLVTNSRHCDFTLLLKRFLDFSLTATACMLLSPLLIGIVIAIRLSSKGPILYGQKRVGRNGREFVAWKFRSMVPNADAVLQKCLQDNPAFKEEWELTHKLKRDPRVTTIGRFLRTTSLDELPQLFNILNGDMSIVGPRPVINSPTYDATYIYDYPNEFAIYTSVRPGLTGVWQVTCRNSGVYEMRIYWDMYYIRNWSLWLDLYIMLRTIRTVLLREGSA